MATCNFCVKLMLMKSAKDPTQIEIRRLPNEFERFDELLTAIEHLWNCAPSVLKIEYVDDEGDNVRITSQAEWVECLRLHKDMAQRGVLPCQTILNATSSSSSAFFNETMPAVSSKTVSRIPALKLLVRPDPSRKKMKPLTQLDSTAAPAEKKDAPSELPPSYSESQQHFERTIVADENAALLNGDVVPIQVTIPLKHEICDAVMGAPAVAPPLADETVSEVKPVSIDRNADPIRDPPVPIVLKTCGHVVGILPLLDFLFSCNSEMILKDVSNRNAAMLFNGLVHRVISYEHGECVVQFTYHSKSLQQFTIDELNKKLSAPANIQCEEAEFGYALALAVWPKQPVLLYNLGCARALGGNIVGAACAVRDALMAGFDDVNQVFTDPDLAELRDSDAFIGEVCSKMPFRPRLQPSEIHVIQKVLAVLPETNIGLLRSLHQKHHGNVQLVIDSLLTAA